VINRAIIVTNPRGLHARSASAIVKLGQTFESSVKFEKDGRFASGRNIMELLLLEAPKGTSLVLHCEGPDEEQAAREMIDLFARNFGETET
jgi:phosphotransferase system HPr (HPr) family protein